MLTPKFEAMSHIIRGSLMIEQSRIPKLSGFPSLAAFIASDRDRTTLIYKRFNEIAARNLLYLQSELAELQAQQRLYDQEDILADLPTKQCARNYLAFDKAVISNDEKQLQRHALMLRTRQTLKDYREALLFENTLATIPPPTKGVLRAFQKEFYNEDMKGGEPFPTLGGNSAGIYDDRDDLVGLGVLNESDRLTTFAHAHLAFMFPDRKRSKNGIAYASDRAIGSFVAWFSTFLAALLLIGAIVILYKVHTPDARLGLIATFTALFAGSVGLLTNARRAEIFAATAAYAAVLVVFVSGDLGNSQNG